MSDPSSRAIAGTAGGTSSLRSARATHSATARLIPRLASQDGVGVRSVAQRDAPDVNEVAPCGAVPVNVDVRPVTGEYDKVGGQRRWLKGAGRVPENPSHEPGSPAPAPLDLRSQGISVKRVMLDLAQGTAEGAPPAFLLSLEARRHVIDLNCHPVEVKGHDTASHDGV
jgi:hypothetical protein